MSRYKDFFSDESQFGADFSFSLSDDESVQTDDEIRAMWEGNFSAIKNNTRLATNLFDNTKIDTEGLEMRNIKSLIYDLILSKNIRGSQLVNFIHNNLSDSLIHKHKKFISRLLNDQYLLGNAYIDLSPYDSCVNLKSSIKKSPSMDIIKCNSCTSCQYNLDNSCAYFNKRLHTSIESLDIPKISRELGFSEITDRDSLSLHIESSLKDSEDIKVNESFHVPCVKGNLKESSQQFEVGSLDLSNQNWDEVKASYKSPSTKKLLKFYLSNRMASKTLNFRAMFENTDVTDLKPFKTYLIKLARSVGDEEDVYDIFDDVEHFFSEYNTKHREIEKSFQDEYQWYNMRTNIPVQANSELTINNMSWEDLKKETELGPSKKLFNLYVYTRAKNNNLDLNKMFASSNPTELNSLISRESINLIQNEEGFRDIFKIQSSNSFSGNKKESFLDVINKSNLKKSSVDFLKEVRSKSGYTKEEIITQVTSMLDRGNIERCLSFISQNEMEPSLIKDVFSIVVNQKPSLSNICSKITKRALKLSEVTEDNSTNILNSYRDKLYSSVFGEEEDVTLRYIDGDTDNESDFEESDGLYFDLD